MRSLARHGYHSCYGIAAAALCAVALLCAACARASYELGYLRGQVAASLTLARSGGGDCGSFQTSLYSDAASAGALPEEALAGAAALVAVATGGGGREVAVRTAERVGRAREHVLLTLVSGNGNECVLLLGGSVLEGDCAAAAALAAAADDDANREEVEPGRRALHQLPGEALPAGLRRGQERKWLLRYHVASEAERGAQLQAWQRHHVAVPSAVCLTPEP